MGAINNALIMAQEFDEACVAHWGDVWEKSDFHIFGWTKQLRHGEVTVCIERGDHPKVGAGLEYIVTGGPLGSYTRDWHRDLEDVMEVLKAMDSPAPWHSPDEWGWE